jgi:hypothetical protein
MSTFTHSTHGLRRAMKPLEAAVKLPENGRFARRAELLFAKLSFDPNTPL